MSSRVRMGGRRGQDRGRGGRGRSEIPGEASRLVLPNSTFIQPARVQCADGLLKRGDQQGAENQRPFVIPRRVPKPDDSDSSTGEASASCLGSPLEAAICSQSSELHCAIVKDPALRFKSSDSCLSSPQGPTLRPQLPELRIASPQDTSYQFQSQSNFSQRQIAPPPNQQMFPRWRVPGSSGMTNAFGNGDTYSQLFRPGTPADIVPRYRPTRPNRPPPPRFPTSSSALSRTQTENRFSHSSDEFMRSPGFARLVSPLRADQNKITSTGLHAGHNMFNAQSQPKDDSLSVPSDSLTPSMDSATTTQSVVTSGLKVVAVVQPQQKVDPSTTIGQFQSASFGPGTDLPRRDSCTGITEDTANNLGQLREGIPQPEGMPLNTNFEDGKDGQGWRGRGNSRGSDRGFTPGHWRGDHAGRGRPWQDRGRGFGRGGPDGPHIEHSKPGLPLPQDPIVERGGLNHASDSRGAVHERGKFVSGRGDHRGRIRFVGNEKHEPERRFTDDFPPDREFPPGYNSREFPLPPSNENRLPPPSGRDYAPPVMIADDLLVDKHRDRARMERLSLNCEDRRLSSDIQRQDDRATLISSWADGQPRGVFSEYVPLERRPPGHEPESWIRDGPWPHNPTHRGIPEPPTRPPGNGPRGPPPWDGPWSGDRRLHDGSWHDDREPQGRPLEDGWSVRDLEQWHDDRECREDVRPWLGPRSPRDVSWPEERVFRDRAWSGDRPYRDSPLPNNQLPRDAPWPDDRVHRDVSRDCSPLDNRWSDRHLSREKSWSDDRAYRDSSWDRPPRDDRWPESRPSREGSWSEDSARREGSWPDQHISRDGSWYDHRLARDGTWVEGRPPVDRHSGERRSVDGDVWIEGQRMCSDVAEKEWVEHSHGAWRDDDRDGGEYDYRRELEAYHNGKHMGDGQLPPRPDDKRRFDHGMPDEAGEFRTPQGPRHRRHSSTKRSSREGSRWSDIADVPSESHKRHSQIDEGEDQNLSRHRHRHRSHSKTSKHKLSDTESTEANHVKHRRHSHRSTSSRNRSKDGTADFVVAASDITTTSVITAIPGDTAADSHSVVSDRKHRRHAHRSSSARNAGSESITESDAVADVSASADVKAASDLIINFEVTATNAVTAGGAGPDRDVANVVSSSVIHSFPPHNITDSASTSFTAETSDRKHRRHSHRSRNSITNNDINDLNENNITAVNEFGAASVVKANERVSDDGVSHLAMTSTTDVTADRIINIASEIDGAGDRKHKRHSHRSKRITTGNTDDNTTVTNITAGCELNVTDDDHAYPEEAVNAEETVTRDVKDCVTHFVTDEHITSQVSDTVGSSDKKRRRHSHHSKKLVTKEVTESRHSPAAAKECINDQMVNHSITDSDCAIAENIAHDVINDMTLTSDRTVSGTACITDTASDHVTSADNVNKSAAESVLNTIESREFINSGYLSTEMGITDLLTGFLKNDKKAKVARSDTRKVKKQKVGDMDLLKTEKKAKVVKSKTTKVKKQKVVKSSKLKAVSRVNEEEMNLKRKENTNVECKETKITKNKEEGEYEDDVDLNLDVKKLEDVKEDEEERQPDWIRCSPADPYFKRNPKTFELMSTRRFLKIQEEFDYQLLNRASRVRASKPPVSLPPRLTLPEVLKKVRKNKKSELEKESEADAIVKNGINKPVVPGNVDSEDDDDDDDDESGSDGEELLWADELKWKRNHPERLHDEMWFNLFEETKAHGIRHNIYPNEEPILNCNPESNNRDRLFHYRITMSPHTNFLTKDPTLICHDGHEYIFEGFSLFSHYKLEKIPTCTVIRFNIEYTIHFFEEEMLEHFNVRSLDQFSDYLYRELLELIDLDWAGQSFENSCRRFHIMPRFARPLPENGKEILSMNEVLSYLISSARPLVEETELASSLTLDDHEWQNIVDDVRGMIVTYPGMRPCSLRIDQLDREQKDPDVITYPKIIHFGVRPAQLSYAGDSTYQKLWKQFMKQKHLVANKPKVAVKDREKLQAIEDQLQAIRLKGSMKREMTVEISSEGFLRTGIKSDICQHALLLPVLIQHLRFHKCLDVLEENIGYRFKDRMLLQLALTHPSYKMNFGTNPDHARNSLTNCGMRQLEYGDRRIHFLHTRKRGINTLMYIMSKMANTSETASEIHHYERLEFLGDAVIEFLSSIHLFFMFPRLEEGGLATYRAALVQNQHLTVLSEKLGLQNYMLYAHGPDLCRDLDLKHAMANCFEALMGSLFLDGGIDVADKVFGEALFKDESELLNVWVNVPRHPLQEDEPNGDRHWIEMSEPLKNMRRFEEKTGIVFNHIRLLAKAFTMRNITYNNLTLGHNQTLEFLGDTVLQFISSDYLFKHFPDHHEGHLTLLRSSLVNNRTQAIICDDLGMTEFIINTDQQVKERMNNEKNKVKDKADILEAFIGALYVDQGLEPVTVLCHVCFFPRLREFIMNQDWNDAKSKLQQCCLTLREASDGDPDIPIYKVLQSTGPTNTRKYHVAVYFKRKRLATGIGHSIQQAEMNAAANALDERADMFPLLKHVKHFLDRRFNRHSSENNTGNRGRRERNQGNRFENSNAGGGHARSTGVPSGSLSNGSRSRLRDDEGLVGGRTNMGRDSNNSRLTWNNKNHDSAGNRSHRRTETGWGKHSSVFQRSSSVGHNRQEHRRLTGENNRTDNVRSRSPLKRSAVQRSFMRPCAQRLLKQSIARQRVGKQVLTRSSQDESLEGKSIITSSTGVIRCRPVIRSSRSQMLKPHPTLRHSLSNHSLLQIRPSSLPRQVRHQSNGRTFPLLRSPSQPSQLHRPSYSPSCRSPSQPSQRHRPSYSPQPQNSEQWSPRPAIDEAWSPRQQPKRPWSHDRHSPRGWSSEQRSPGDWSPRQLPATEWSPRPQDSRVWPTQQVYRQWSPGKQSSRDWSPRPPSPREWAPRSPEQWSPRHHEPRDWSPRRQAAGDWSPRHQARGNWSPRQQPRGDWSPRQAPRNWSPRQNASRDWSPRQHAPRDWSPVQRASRDWSPRQQAPRDWSPRQLSTRDWSPRDAASAAWSPPRKTRAREWSPSELQRLSSPDPAPVSPRQRHPRSWSPPY